jgi:hypothetical protein
MADIFWEFHFFPMNILKEFPSYSAMYTFFQYKNSMGNKLGNEVVKFINVSSFQIKLN